MEIINYFKKMYHRIRKLNIAKAGKWSICFVIIGLIAGLGSIVFTYMCKFGVYFFMDFISGYRPLTPAGESHLFEATSTPFNKWILLFLPAFGGILSGWLVYTFAPEAEGHGTDAAIDAYHNKGGEIRARIPFIKTIASAVTLTTGGSGGREGPIAQIGAGFGSFLATKLKLSYRERRIMMAAGVAAGVGSIFRAPLAGALFAAEVLYRDPDFESEIIIPAGISSVIAYCIFCLVFGWGALFDSPGFEFRHPVELGPYLFLSVILVMVGILYIKTFYGVIKLFRSLNNIPNHIKPAIGGMVTGIIGFFVSDALSFGYGFIQKAIYNEFTILALIILAVAKILTTSFSIGSGGSGGVFGPSIVIGGAIGGAVGTFFNQFTPLLVKDPGAFIIVGMAGFFTAVSNAPISTIIFVSEMTNSYHLLLPSLLVCSVTYALSKRWSIFHSQVKSRIDSPAHAGDFFVDVLASIKVRDLISKIRKVDLIPQGTSLSKFKKYFCHTTQHYFPVVDENENMISVFSASDIRSILFEVEVETLILARDIGSHNVITTTLEENLNSVFKKFTIKNIDSLPVVKIENKRKLIGMINRREVINFYNKKIEEMKSTTND